MRHYLSTVGVTGSNPVSRTMVLSENDLRRLDNPKEAYLVTDLVTLPANFYERTCGRCPGSAPGGGSMAHPKRIVPRRASDGPCHHHELPMPAKRCSKHLRPHGDKETGHRIGHQHALNELVSLLGQSQRCCFFRACRRIYLVFERT